MDQPWGWNLSDYEDEEDDEIQEEEEEHADQDKVPVQRPRARNQHGKANQASGLAIRRELSRGEL